MLCGFFCCFLLYIWFGVISKIWVRLLRLHKLISSLTLRFLLNEHCENSGHEAAGIVSQVGEGVTNVKIGDKVAIEPGNYIIPHNLIIPSMSITAML